MERDEHGQLLSLDGMTSDQLSDEIAAAETRMTNLDTALALYEARIEAGAIPAPGALGLFGLAAGAAGIRRKRSI